MAIKNILILGYGKLGKWIAQELSKNYKVMIYEKNLLSVKETNNLQFIRSSEEISSHSPDLIINAVNLNNTVSSFDSVLKYLPDDAILSDITSLKEGMLEYYKRTGFRFVSTHPMFGPTQGNMNNLKDQNALIIEESDNEGTNFFINFYRSQNIRIHFISFYRHDKLMSEALSLPFLTLLSFAANTEEMETPGTTYQKESITARKLLNEDTHLIAEILLNPNSLKQIDKLNSFLEKLYNVILSKDYKEMLDIINHLKEKSLVSSNKIKSGLWH
jgi:prephenate dehydrogenase